MASSRGTLTVCLGGMKLPRVSRPFMPGYGIAAADEGSGLLPWSWAAQRLTSAQNYWVASIRPDSGAPHATFSVRPERVFGMVHGDFTGSPTRWTFAD